MKLRDYQSEGFEDIFDAWLTDDILMYINATGGGKTCTFVEVIRSVLAEGKRVMLIAHRRELIRQAQKTLKRQEIDAALIMGDSKTDYSNPVQICSIQTIARRENLPPVDYIIIDEGHHAQPNNTYGNIIARYPEAKVLLVTATPYRLNGDGFEFIHPKKKTRLILNRDLPQLQGEGWLVPIKYYAASIPDLSNVRLRGGDYRDDDAAEAMSLAPIVESYLEHARGRCGVCFCVNVEHSKRVAEAYNRVGITAAHLDDQTPNDIRAEILKQFELGFIKIVVNVGIITEGYDMPNMEFVQLACPTKSLSKYLQMVGRVTRPDCNVDKYPHAEQRKYIISKSRKPFGIILDNAGLWLEHNLPEFPRDWTQYFTGLKKAKPQSGETMEMLVYVVEKPDGTLGRTTDINEVKGLRLVEITKEERKKCIDLSILHDFDRELIVLKRTKKINKPGYIAAHNFFGKCESKNILITPEMWQHLEKRLCSEVDDVLKSMIENRPRKGVLIPDNVFEAALKKAKNGGVSPVWLAIQREKYIKANRAQYKELLTPTNP